MHQEVDIQTNGLNKVHDFMYLATQ